MFGKRKDDHKHRNDESKPEEPSELPEVPEVGVVVGLANGEKCERCWRVLPDVGSHADHPDICGRCADAVGGRAAAE